MSFTDNSYKEFLSWNNNEVTSPESPYQIDLPYQELIQKIDYEKLKTDEYYIKPLEKAFRDQYISKILFYLTPPSELKKFLDYHFFQYQGTKEDFIYFAEWTTGELKNLYSTHHKVSLSQDYIFQIIKDWAEEKRSELKTDGKHLGKIKWNGSPSVFGYLFLELVKNGFIEAPVRGGDPNYAGFAKQCFQHFELNTTLENLIKEMNPGKNTLSDTKRYKFPNISDLA